MAYSEGMAGEKPAILLVFNMIRRKQNEIENK